jgi:hypothetical protein
MSNQNYYSRKYNIIDPLCIQQGAIDLYWLIFEQMIVFEKVYKEKNNSSKSQHHTLNTLWENLGRMTSQAKEEV